MQRIARREFANKTKRANPARAADAGVVIT